MGDIFVYLAVVGGVMLAYQLVDQNTLGTLLVGAVGVVVSVVFYFAAMMFAATSTEVWNGEVTSKERVYDPYTESYSCGTDSKGNTLTCTRTVSRWRWDVNSNVGSWSDHTSSAAGVPRIYANAKVGAPFARTKMFMNYQYVSDQTILVNKHDEYAGWLPDYPEIYSGYQIHHALSNVVNVNNLDAMLSWAHKRWGPAYGVNVIVVIVKDTDTGFADALRNKWVGGKKNDAVLVLYVDAEETVKKADAFSRSTQTKRNEMQADFETILREESVRTGTYDFEKIVNVVDKALPYFERENIEQYDYLMTDYNAQWWVVTLGVFVVGGISLAVAWRLGRDGIHGYLFRRPLNRHKSKRKSFSMFK